MTLLSRQRALPTTARKNEKDEENAQVSGGGKNQVPLPQKNTIKLAFPRDRTLAFLNSTETNPLFVLEARLMTPCFVQSTDCLTKLSAYTPNISSCRHPRKTREQG
jgi:hypothetical protein